MKAMERRKKTAATKFSDGVNINFNFYKYYG